MPDFLLRMHRALAAPGKNFFFSPTSIWSALALALYGARGQTKGQLDALMGTGALSREGLLDILTELSVKLNTTVVVENEPKLEMRLANKAYLARSLNPAIAYLAALSKLAGVEVVDFAAAQVVREEINKWVAELTNEMIQNLIPENGISPATLLVLVNAIYFKAKWEKRFDEAFTDTNGQFFVQPNQPVTAPLMYQESSFEAYQDQVVTVVFLPYYGGTTGFLGILPAPGVELEEAEEYFFNHASSIMAEMRSRAVHLYLPRFNLNWGMNLVFALKGLGIEDAFNSYRADFSGIAQNRMYISDVIHKAALRVDEAGSEAAAATAVVMRSMEAISERPLEVKFNRPFLFAIMDALSNELYFLGRLINPAE
ncbi:hypothetical protein A2382_01890 [Candidatus Woesebacteria bacterium RIFOXYB1_FULL_38_16]|uniref:Serpin domain-containing protein n=1 Tax=Candidatus Woesebacteria bacterium RIFOXYB1_FULL_38_16 TaxID=1802538 RepID=A0A1F8CTJ4_9BACT|nr:MAG: hypothetical protein A2382_01890 [Candidatus Woesebacteria bacterium RIFOXYB1_FULL_38_16]